MSLTDTGATGQPPVAPTTGAPTGVPGQPAPQYQTAQVAGLPANYNGTIYTEEEVRAQLQQREADVRNRYYAEREAEREELARLRAEAEQRNAAETQRADAERQAQEEARRAAEALEMDARTLVERRTSELEQAMATQRAEFEAELARRDAILNREREYQALETYRVQVVAANADQILPELQDLVQGNTQAEIDASVARLVERTANILTNVTQAGRPDPSQIQGVAPRSPALGPESMVGGQRQLSNEDIAAMPMSEWSRIRGQVLGGGGRQSGDRGLFG